jgi:hypothetical protein
MELAHLRATAAEGVEQLPGCVEAVDPVAPVGDEQGVVGGHRDRADRAELARPRPRDADLAQEGAVAPEDLDDVRGLVADVDRAVGPDRHGLREAQDAFAALADLRAGDVRAGRGRARAVGGGGRRRRGDRAERRECRARAQPARAPGRMSAEGHRRVQHAARG